LEKRKAVICHCGWISSWRCGVAKEVCKTTSICVAKPRSFYGAPVHFLQGFPFCPYSRRKQDQKMRCGFMFWWRGVKLSSIIVLFRNHQNKGRTALHVGLSSLYKGDSSFDHVLLLCLTVPRLDRMHQNTITMHSHDKTGIVVQRSGMWCNGILMHPKNTKILLPHKSVILDLSPFPNASFFLFFNDSTSFLHHDRHFPRNDRLSTFLLFFQQNPK
jgi:hypothetical protein